MAAPVAAIAGAEVVAKEAAGVVRSIINALQRPIYSNLATTTVTHVAKNGDVIVRTRSKGWTVPQGVVIFGVGIALLWEVGLAVSKAFNTAIKDAGEVLAAPLMLAVDIATFEIQAIQTVGGWFGLKTGTVSQNPPANTQVVAAPPTAMAAHNQWLSSVFTGIGVPTQTLVSKLLSALSNANAAVSGSPGAKPADMFASWWTNPTGAAGQSHGHGQKAP